MIGRKGERMRRKNVGRNFDFVKRERHRVRKEGGKADCVKGIKEKRRNVRKIGGKIKLCKKNKGKMTENKEGRKKG